MAVRGVDNSVGWNAKDQFPLIDPWQQTRFRKQPVVGSVVEFEDTFERIGIIRQARQYGYTAIGKLGRNEPVRTALINGSNRKHIDLPGSCPRNYLPPRRLSSKRRTPIMAGTPPRVK